MARRRVTKPSTTVDEPIVVIDTPEVETSEVEVLEVVTPEVEETIPEIVSEVVETPEEPVIEVVPPVIESPKNVETGYDGVRFEGGLYRVELNVNDTLTYFGSYENLLDALSVRDKIISRYE